MAEPPSPRPDPLEEDDLDAEDFKPRSRGSVSFGLTLVGLVLAGYLLFDSRAELAYWARSAAPIDLGTTTAYYLDRVADNSVATIQGVPGPVASRFTLLGQEFEIVAVRGTSILVRRAPTGTAQPGKPPPPPDQQPFSATGRLLQDTSIPQYQDAFRTLVERGEAVPRGEHLWVLLDGELPRSGWKVPAAVVGLAALLAFNGYALVRYLRRRALTR